MSKRRILVTGSRDWGDVQTLENALAAYVGDEVTLVSGACPTGADLLAEVFAKRAGWEVERHPADWDKRGKAAGPLRNQEMVDLGADVCVAFPLGESRGTRDCMSRAEGAGIPVRVVVDRWAS